MIQIDHDYAGGRERDGLVIESMPLYGIERAMGEDDAIPNTGPLVPFRTVDDDGEWCHQGRLTDDDECINQSAALRWAESDAGATRIFVKRIDGWKEEIA